MLKRAHLALALALFLSACGPPWRLVRSSGTPSALAGVTSFAVSFDASHLEVDGEPEAAWLAAHEDEHDAYVELRAAIDAAMIAELGEHLEGASFLPAAEAAADVYPLVVRYDALAMGSFGPIYSTASELDVTIRLGSGERVDELALRTSRRADVYNTQRLERLVWCVDRIASGVAEYVRRAQ